MSHAIYQTQAFIVDIKNLKDENKLVCLYTERFGLLYVHVQSARKLKSKMNAHLHSFSFVNVDLVLGKSIWRLTGIFEIKNSLSYSATEKYYFLEKYASFLKRLCVDEESHAEIWKDLLYYSQHGKEDFKISFHEKEILSLYRMLASLGYIHTDSLFFKEKVFFNETILSSVNRQKSGFIKKINQALENSHL